MEREREGRGNYSRAEENVRKIKEMDVTLGNKARAAVKEGTEMGRWVTSND